jgi:general secretion pathway protein E
VTSQTTIPAGTDEARLQLISRVHRGDAVDPNATVSPTAGSPTPEFLSRVSHDFARRHLVLSEGCVDGVERLVAAEHAKPSVVFNVGVLLRRPVRARHAPAEAVAAAVDQAYASAADAAAGAAESDVPSVIVEGSEAVETELDAAVREAERDLLSTQGKAPAVRLVDLVLFEALQRSASDVHVQPVRDRTLVRYRLDGALHTVRELPASLASSVVSRIKVMARLDVAERRAPQDGRATVTIGGAGGAHAGRRVDLRISTLPSTYGERVVLRLLDPSRSPHLLNFAALGMPPEVEHRYLAQVSRTSGIVLSTGPTGSGKTTTLYATLAWLSTTNAGAQARGCELNMMTVEDPVEYDLATGGRGGGGGGAGLSVSQTQVDPKKGVTFVTGLKHILRQDPDVIMVGEVRDEETARIAVQASLTGHLVLSTLHTNDAASAVARLLDLGVEPFLVSSSLSAVLAQRLVRTKHSRCEGVGCPECLGTGFKGRTGVFELLVLDAPIRELVCRRASALDIKAAAQRPPCGMVSLREAGERLADAGVTTREEVGRVIDALDEVET